jgi:hypothetical protein
LGDADGLFQIAQRIFNSQMTETAARSWTARTRVLRSVRRLAYRSDRALWCVMTLRRQKNPNVYERLY